MRLENSKIPYDIIVVGAGHAGIEASLAASRLGLRTLCLTVNLERIGHMSCNPSIGGLAKGHIVREVDILGGEMGFVADSACIQFKRLNSKKGPAVRGSRAQCDKDLYAAMMAKTMLSQVNLDVREGEVKSLAIDNGVCAGIYLEDGSLVRSRAVILTTGTFMNAVMHMGFKQTSGGRVGDKASIGLSDQLRSLGFRVRRLKTGTPPRLLRGSIDFSKTRPQSGDELFYPFSSRSSRLLSLPQVQCFLSYTNEKTHDIIRKNLDKSPLFCGQIEGQGPRYCPSIEDKITRFAEKAGHQTFLEPEGLSTESVYLQGISTSLPAETQLEFLRTIPGLEAVEMIRPGYAVEYDFVEPDQIRHSFECRDIPGLYLAGQVNGTSGYEEAAGQGLLAGINASRNLTEKSELVLRRDQAYAGVLIDDLVTKGTKEPYRMFTSRAEFRLVLREDNTIDRLFEISRQVGLKTGQELDQLGEILVRRRELADRICSRQLVPDALTLGRLSAIGTASIVKPVSLAEVLRRPDVDIEMLDIFGLELDPDPFISDAVEIDIKYRGYIERQDEMIAQTMKLEGFRLPELDYFQIKGLKLEEREKLSRIRPSTLGQASRISGVNPSAIQAIVIHLRTQEKIRLNQMFHVEH